MEHILLAIGFPSGDNYALHPGPCRLGGFVLLFLGLGRPHFLTQKDYLLPDYIYENKVESL